MSSTTQFSSGESNGKLFERSRCHRELLRWVALSTESVAAQGVPECQTQPLDPGAKIFDPAEYFTTTGRTSYTAYNINPPGLIAGIFCPAGGMSRRTSEEIRAAIRSKGAPTKIIARKQAMNRWAR